MPSVVGLAPLSALATLKVAMLGREYARTVTSVVLLAVRPRLSVTVVTMESVPDWFRTPEVQVCPVY